MADTDKKEVERVLREGVEALEDALRGIANDTASLRPSPESWSVLECVQHIGLTERALLGRLKQATPAGASREDKAREARFQDLAMNRQRRIEAPEVVTPKPGSQSLPQALDEFQKIRGDTMRFVDEFEGDLKAWLAVHPLITRPVNCFEMLLLIALHPKRHALQISQIREQLSHPRSQML